MEGHEKLQIIGGMEKENNSDSDTLERTTPTEVLGKSAGVPISSEERSLKDWEIAKDLARQARKIIKDDSNKVTEGNDGFQEKFQEFTKQKERSKDFLQRQLQRMAFDLNIGRGQNTVNPVAIDRLIYDEMSVQKFHGTELPGMLPSGDPPRYEEIFSDNQGDIEHLAEKDQISHAVFKREFSSLRRDVSERFGSMEGILGSMKGGLGSMEGKFRSMEGRLGSMEGKLVSMEDSGSREGKFELMAERLVSMEGTMTEARQEIHQTHQTQQIMNERLERIEHGLELKQPQIELNEDRVSQRVVELLMRNEHFGARMMPINKSIECGRSLGHDIKLPIRTSSCHACHFQNQYSNWENVKKDATSNKGSRKASADKSNKKEVNLRNSEIEDKQFLLGACGGDPGDSPSDDSSSDDDDHSGHKNMNSRKDKRRQNESWEIDAEAWIACVDGGNFEQQAVSLLEQKKLPNKIGLKAIGSKYTLSSLILREICNNICFYIKKKSKRIVHVWAATEYLKGNSSCSDDIVFVVLTTDTEKIYEENFITRQRCSLPVEETVLNKQISKKEFDNPLNPEEKEKLEKCLRENGKLLMDSHSNLTRVTASWYKVVNDNTETPSIKRELCIALYVHIKGYVPVGEKHFPTEIGGFPVVVREGIFTFCRGANEYHQNVKMGCAVRGERHGTLGAFVEFENDTNLYGLTCAHVVFGDNKLRKIVEKGTIFFNDNSETVYQPASETEIKPLGATDAVFYKSGGNGLTGMEIALININQDRWPTEGTFPDDSDYAAAGFGREKPFVYCSGRVFDTTISRPQSLVVYKYGCESKLTHGMCRVNGASVRTMKLKEDILDTELVLHGQIEIQQLESSPFAENGDSGALVFIDDAGHGLSALGIFEGRMNGVYMITPIYDVLHELYRLKNKQCRLKMFSPLDHRINDTRDLWDTVPSLSANVRHVQNKLDNLEQGFAQDLAQHKTEITDELRKQHDEHKKSSLEIKHQQEQHKEELKRQNEELRRQGEEYKKQSEEIQDIKSQNAQILAILTKLKS